MASEKSNAQKVASVWSRLFNPLRSLTKTQIERMVEDMHHGDDVRAQLVFSEIEAQSDIYHLCIDKRVAGVLGREWDVLPTDETPEARRQAEKVKKVLEESDMRNEDGLTQALSHLVLSAFRGRAVVKPFFTEDGRLFFKNLENWNVLQWNGRLYWNPSSEPVGWFDDSIPDGVTELPIDEVCALFSQRPIDVPGLLIYLRMLVGENNWSRFIEKQGIPQILLTVPEGTPDEALDQWNWRAKSLYEGGSGAMPYGSKCDVLDSARGQDPFSEYLRHQREAICILAVGGSLNVLGGATGLGSNLADVQQQAFNSLVNADCKRISNAVT